jgi:hypothetical protein
MSSLTFPGGKRFAFTVIDDTDCSTVRNVRPVYELLHELGLRTTKTIWPLPGHHPDDKNSPGQPVTDAEYREFISQLQSWRFEIALHNVRSFSSERQEIERGLATFQAITGKMPNIHANHMFNRDDLYWGDARLDLGLVGWLYRKLRSRRGVDTSQGHLPGSPFFWGDLCQKHVKYVRGFTYPEINALRFNPSMPYRDRRRPYVNLWFSGSDASNVFEFNRLLRPENQERLERARGVCIVATHFASGFAINGKVNPQTEQLLRSLADREGWFVPVSEVLDLLVSQGAGKELPWLERQRMQLAWLWTRFTELQNRRADQEALKKTVAEEEQELISSNNRNS